MIRSEATLAIVLTRLLRELPVIALAAAACALVAFLQRFDDGPATFAGAMVFGTLTGVVTAALQRGAGRFREIELCELAAPLYGRELARATAAVPCVIVTAALCAYWGTEILDAQRAPVEVGVTLAACYAATLVAMCAAVRRSVARLLYVLLACFVAAAAFALSWRSEVLAVLFCTICGFVALRQYGEALARYDPV